MATVREHYDGHLGPVYGWMIGDFDVATAAARAELRDAALPQGAGRVAIDLGAGPGAHAIALAEAGYAVTAIDTCATLLNGLRARAGRYVIRCVDDDLLRMRYHVQGVADVIVCMGDTLTHLPSQQSVEQLFEAIAGTLRPGGMFMATFRDYQSRTMEGVERFIPVRQDSDRMLTCFIEYHQKTVTIHDLLYERTDAGWMLHVSSYSKLRLAPESARATLARLGLIATLDAGPKGMVRLMATRPT
jgi:SAM-dependent methyltransferase